MDAFQAYVKTTAIKLHFTSPSYDYFKYRGSVRTTRDRFEVRNDKYFYHKLSKKFNEEELEFFLASNFSVNPKMWVGNLFEESSLLVHQEALKYCQGMAHFFKQDMMRFENLDDALLVKGGAYPNIFFEFRNKKIAKETLAIINRCLKVFPYWIGAVDDPVVLPDALNRIEKYSYFMDVDEQRFNNLMLDIYK